MAMTRYSYNRDVARVIKENGQYPYQYQYLFRSVVPFRLRPVMRHPKKTIITINRTP
jgi:hypothetical protein